MDEFILNMTELEIKDFMANIKSEHLCLLMIILGPNAKNKLLNTLSDKAQNLLLSDVAKYENHLKSFVP